MVIKVTVEEVLKFVEGEKAELIASIEVDGSNKIAVHTSILLTYETIIRFIKTGVPF